MRIRTIKPEFFKHDGLSEIEPIARLLFVGLWCMADKEGRLEDRPKRIKAEVLPYDQIEIEDLLTVLAKRGFIVRYDCDGLLLIEIPNFARHQRITGKEAETESKYPSAATGKQRGNNGETTETTGREGKGKEGKGESAPTTLVFPGDLNCEEFRKAWERYEAYRRESKMRRLKDSTVEAKLAEMATWGKSAAIEAIENTIRNGWQGIFEPKNGRGESGPLFA